MRLDVLDLDRFYKSPIGRAAERMIARRLAAIWPDVHGLDILGLGYAAPYLGAFRSSARRTVCAMPAEQGVARWPDGGRAESVLVDEVALPFRDSFFDRTLVAHVVEETESLTTVLREVWRTTAPEGRIIVVAANRMGPWSRFETSPFGHGRSFTRGQLAKVLQDAAFEPTASARALYCPPLGWGPVLDAAEAWERAGERAWPNLGGVILIEAIKRVVAETPKGRRRLVFAPAAAAPPPAAQPAWRDREPVG